MQQQQQTVGTELNSQAWPLTPPATPTRASLMGRTTSWHGVQSIRVHSYRARRENTCLIPASAPGSCCLSLQDAFLLPRVVLVLPELTVLLRVPRSVGKDTEKKKGSNQMLLADMNRGALTQDVRRFKHASPRI